MIHKDIFENKSLDSEIKVNKNNFINLSEHNKYKIIIKKLRDIIYLLMIMLKDENLEKKV